jgi:DNA-binding transcriptional regulator WhiA
MSKALMMVAIVSLFCRVAYATDVTGTADCKKTYSSDNSALKTCYYGAMLANGYVKKEENKSKWNKFFGLAEDEYTNCMSQALNICDKNYPGTGTLRSACFQGITNYMNVTALIYFD